MDRLANALVGSAAADIALHGFVDVFVAGLGFFGEQRGGLHDLAALAVAALSDIAFAPGDLHGMFALGVEAFDGGDFLAFDGGHWRNATALGLAIDVDGACAAESCAASEFGAGHVEEISHVPKHWHLRVSVELTVDSIDLELDHDLSGLLFSGLLHREG